MGRPSEKRVFDNEQRFAVFDGCAVIDQDFFDDAGFFGFDFVHQLHGFDDAQGVACLDLLADFDECGCVRAGCAVEGADHRRFLRVGQIADSRCGRYGGRGCRGNRRGGYGGDGGGCGKNGLCGSGAGDAYFFFPFGYFDFGDAGFFN